MWKHTTCSVLFVQGRWEAKVSMHSSETINMHKLCILVTNGLSICYICQKLQIREKGKGGGREGRHNDYLKLAYSVTLRRWTQAQRTQHRFGGEGSDTKLSYSPLYRAIHVKTETISNMRGQVVAFSRLPAFSWSSRKQRRWLLFLGTCPGVARACTAGPTAWWPALTQLFFFCRTSHCRKPITVQPTVPGEAAAKPQGQ